MNHKGFLADTSALIRPEVKYDAMEASNLVSTETDPVDMMALLERSADARFTFVDKDLLTRAVQPQTPRQVVGTH